MTVTTPTPHPLCAFTGDGCDAQYEADGVFPDFYIPLATNSIRIRRPLRCKTVLTVAHSGLDSPYATNPK